MKKKELSILDNSNKSSLRYLVIILFILFTNNVKILSQNITASVDSATIVNVANETNKFYQSQAKLASARVQELDGTISFWNYLTKIVQYVGGAGAIIFGLNDNGKNAAYSGAIAALGTLVDQLSNTNSKVSERSNCFTLTKLNRNVFSVTLSWVASADNKEFQKTFAETLKKFTEDQNNAFGECNLDLDREYKAKIKSISQQSQMWD